MKSVFRSTGILVGMAIMLESQAGSIDPELASLLAQSRPDETVAVIIDFSNKYSMQSQSHKRRDAKHREAVLRGLRGHAETEQGEIKNLLKQQRITQHKQLWLNNALAVEVPAKLVKELAAARRVSSVRLDKKINIQAALAGSPAAAEWNISALHADTLWTAGYTGQGVVVGSMDTGVDYQHPDLSARWRGGSNSWFDPYGQHALPHDVDGHGTQSTSLIVGGDAGGTSIGVAPGAQWIAAKIFNDAGVASLSAIHAGFQWMLDPDNNPATDDSADIVNNSWDLTSAVNLCDAEFQADINTLRAAGVAVVFAAGNTGSAVSTSMSPANNAGALAVGAVDTTLNVAYFSSRGPSACNGNIYPQLVAPGMDVLAADLTFGGVVPNSYYYVSGTSFSAPHVAGALALLQSAFPASSLQDRETALQQTAVDLDTAGADNATGYGLADVAAAYNQLAGTTPPPPASNSPPVAVADSASTNEDNTVVISLVANDTDADGDLVATSVILASTPTHGSAGVNVDGSVSYTPSANYSGADSFSYRVSDLAGNSSNPATVSITVSPVNDAPVAGNDAYSVVGGTTLSVAAAGVLSNDTDIDSAGLSAIVSTAPNQGSLTLNTNGSFSYIPSVGYVGTDSFSYVASDGVTSSNPATVTITVTAPPVANKTPVANPDSASVKKNTRTTAYNVTITVLANDTDADGTLNPASVKITRTPSKGTLVVNADGTVKYTPAAGKSGSDSFTYTVKDNVGAVSNKASVSISIL
ncbi:MAG: tandem-95 repeat protein [Gammaproteobacteria bacterium]|nr:tandem-95 repeat protein [Gammaproteobacteria bacterium]